MSKQEWLLFLGCAALSIKLLTACGGAPERVRLPDDCSTQSERVRLQLCPEAPLGLVCSDVAQTNPYPGVCDGPSWTEGKQVSGNAWCCFADVFEVYQ